MFFTGQVLRWDPDAYWGLAVGGSMAGRVPVIGPRVVRLLLGGPVIGGDSLSRFFALHVFVIPGALLFFLAVHLWLVLKCGISAPPVPGQAGRSEDLRRRYEKELKTRRPLPRRRHAEGRLLLGAGRDRGGGRSPRSSGPKGPTGPPDPTLGGANPRPEWPFLWLFALLSLSPPEAETFIILVFPVILIVALFLVPFVSNRGERAPSRRPVAVLLGHRDLHGPRRADLPGSHRALVAADDRLERRPDPRGYGQGARPLQLQGAVVFQNKNCRNCHALEGSGGQRGPDLTGVGTRLTRDQLIDQISNGTPGGGNMPAYGKQIEPAEMTALVDFLVQPAARGPAAGRDGRRRGTPAKNGHEPHARRLPALLAVRPWLLAALARDGRRLSARLARPPPPRPARWHARPARRVSRLGWRRSSWPWRRRSSRSPRCCCKSTWCSTCCS